MAHRSGISETVLTSQVNSSQSLEVLPMKCIADSLSKQTTTNKACQRTSLWNKVFHLERKPQRLNSGSYLHWIGLRKPAGKRKPGQALLLASSIDLCSRLLTKSEQGLDGEFLKLELSTNFLSRSIQTPTLLQLWTSSHTRSSRLCTYSCFQPLAYCSCAVVCSSTLQIGCNSRVYLCLLNV